MSLPRLPQLGSVIWAEIADANGVSELRPAVVVTATANIASQSKVHLVAITTRLPMPLPEDHVLLPWNHQGTGRSGLRRKCADVASWQAEIPLDKVQWVVGILPPDVIRELLAKNRGNASAGSKRTEERRVKVAHVCGMSPLCSPVSLTNGTFNRTEK